MTRLFSTLALTALAFSATGCDGFSDFVDDPLGNFELQVRVPDVEVDLGAGLTVGVVPGQETTAEFVVPSDFDFATINSIESIDFSADDFSFETAAPRSGEAARRSSAPSGTIRFFGELRTLDGVTVASGGGDLLVVDGQITNVVEIPGERFQAAADALNRGEYTVRMRSEVIQTTDPNQPLAGSLTVYGYNVTIVGTP